MEIIKNKRILALIGIICLFLGTFLPYVTFSFWGYSSSISLWGYWEGKIVLALTLANALFIFKDWIEKYVPQLLNGNIGKFVEKANNPKFSLVPTIFVALFAIYMLIHIDVNTEYLNYGLGFWLLWIGVIALIGHAIFYKNESKQPIQQFQSQNEQVSYQQTPINAVNQEQKKCLNCGSLVQNEAEHCFMCGNKL